MSDTEKVLLLGKELAVEYISAVCYDEAFHLHFDIVVGEERKNIHFMIRKEEAQRILDDDEPITPEGKTCSSRVEFFIG